MYHTFKIRQRNLYYKNPDNTYAKAAKGEHYCRKVPDPLELDEATRIALQVAEGLRKAHKSGVVHRDIKSANIMVTEEDQAKIMDFGLARMTGGTLVTKEGTTMGHGEEALIHSERAVGLDPFNPLLRSWYAIVLYSQRRYDEAIAEAREALRIQPDFPIATSILWWIMHEKKGMEREAFEAAKVFARVTYNDPRIEAALDEGYAQGGYAEAIKRGAEALIARFQEAFCLPSDIAQFYAMAGEKDKAIEWLEKGLEIHDPVLPYLGLPAFVDPLGDEPRYQELLRKMNLPVDEKE